MPPSPVLCFFLKIPDFFTQNPIFYRHKTIFIVSCRHKLKEFIMKKKFKSPSDEVWAMIKELSKQHEKTKKTIEKSFREVSEQQKKLAKEVSEQQKKTEQLIQETDKQVEKTNRKFNKMFGNFGNDWGKFGENLVKGNLAKRLRERNIEVQKVFTNLKNEFAEFDIIAVNGKEIVVVEVKSKLDKDDVDKFLSNMKIFQKTWPRLSKGKKVYGAVAFLVSSHPKAVTQAQKAGFFVISATGDVVIKNKKNFKTTAFLN